MKRILAAVISAAVMVLGLVGCASESALIVAPHPPSAPAVTPKTMQAFHSENELTAYLRELAAKQTRVMRMSGALVSKGAPPPAAAKSECMAITWWCCGGDDCSRFRSKTET